MGGPGSGRPHENRKRRKTSAIAVCGTGSPVMPDNLPSEVSAYWHRIAELTAGVAFSQDSDAVTEAAWLTWRQQVYRKALAERPLDVDLNKQSLAIGRALSALWSQLGLTPRSRQVLLVAKDETEEPDPLDQLQADYGTP